MKEKKDYDWSFQKDVEKLQELLSFWNYTADKYKEENEHLRKELKETNELLGKVLKQVPKNKVILSDYQK